MKLNRDQVLGLVRHGLTVAGGVLIGRNLVDPATLEVAVSAIVTLVGIAWSIGDKKPR